ncbi:endonuclease NucS [Halobaculum litoreum]|uniref:endonuclease NucS n=1 Tax=Halobaculum litoreum TaxID=3031998 RepID=UPI0024C36E7E|nr:endonuclease NucS [Halobaculum sp. DT92]
MTATTLHDPSHREALWELEAAFDRGDLVTLFGTCSVEYDGRASSSLGPGARLVVLKPDGSALVHTDEGRTPVNWQPPGSEHRAAVRDGRLRVRSVRESPDERLDVRFSAVEHLAAYGVTGGRSVEVVGSEADLKERVLADPAVVEPGFEPLATERETEAGPVDVFGRDAEGRPVVVELKRRRVGPDAAGQLARYVAAVEREEPGGTTVRGVLLAPSVTDRARDLLAEEGLEHVAADPPADGPGDDAP